jgi:nucleoside-diphosphate-sugar epimerase
LPLTEPELLDAQKEGRVEVVEGDVADQAVVERASEGIDATVHTAAALPIQGNREKIMGTNVGGTQNALQAAKKHGVGKVIHISTTAVYGVPKIHPLYETSPIIPLGLYGESKVAAEEACHIAQQDGVDVTDHSPQDFHRHRAARHLPDSLRVDSRRPSHSHHRHGQQQVSVAQR